MIVARARSIELYAQEALIVSFIIHPIMLQRIQMRMLSSIKHPFGSW